MESDIQNQDNLLAFMALYTTAARDGYLGAILITDSHGIPQEFRCTHPVKPTAIQKPLYGERLQPYVGVNLCGIPLMASISSRPSLVIVREDFLLDIRPEIAYPVVLVRRAGDVIDVTRSGSSEKTPTKQRIDCSTGKFQPFVIMPHPDFDEDAVSAAQTLESIFGYFDPIEPFERIEKAIEVLAKQDARFQ